MTKAGEDFTLRSIAVSAFGPAALFGLAEGAMMPVISLSAIDRGANVAIASLIAGLLGIGSILTNIPSGILATRLGERLAMVIAAVVSIIGDVFCLVPPVNVDPVIGLLLFAFGVFLLGAASSVFSLARQSYLTEMVPPHMRARAMSTLGGSMRIGVFIGPFLAAAVMVPLGLTGAYLVSLIAAAGAGVIAYRVPDLGRPGERNSAKATASAAVPPTAETPAATAETSATAAPPAVAPRSARTPSPAAPDEKITTLGMLHRYWRLFITLGTGVLLLSAIRQTRQVVIPLWASHLHLDPTIASIIYGVASAVDALTFYPAGKIMDRFGRRAVAVPSTFVMGAAFLLLPLTHGIVTLAIVSMIIGLGNGVGAGIVMTLGADTSPDVGRPTFLGLWRELADAGSGIGPVILSAVTAIAGLGIGIGVSGLVGFAAAWALYAWIPHQRRPSTTRT